MHEVTELSVTALAVSGHGPLPCLRPAVQPAYAQVMFLLLGNSMPGCLSSSGRVSKLSASIHSKQSGQRSRLHMVSLIFPV